MKYMIQNVNVDPENTKFDDNVYNLLRIKSFTLPNFQRKV